MEHEHTASVIKLNVAYAQKTAPTNTQPNGGDVISRRRRGDRAPNFARARYPNRCRVEYTFCIYIVSHMKSLCDARRVCGRFFSVPRIERKRGFVDRVPSVCRDILSANVNASAHRLIRLNGGSCMRGTCARKRCLVVRVYHACARMRTSTLLCIYKIL